MEIKINKELFPNDFIKENLIDHLSRMIPTDINHGYPYELFILISIGIEFLGACEDSEPWDKEGVSKKRFCNGIRLFSDKYHEYDLFLYSKLRCGMAHVYAPVPGLGLSEDKHGAINLVEHGERDSAGYQLDLNVQSFYSDFKNACEYIINKIKNEEYEIGNKIYKPFLSIPLNNTNDLRK